MDGQPQEEQRSRGENHNLFPRQRDQRIFGTFSRIDDTDTEGFNNRNRVAADEEVDEKRFAGATRIMDRFVILQMM